MRENTKKLLILLTDGEQNPPKYDPAKASQALYDAGVDIIAVGISKDVNEKELEGITRKKENVFYAENFEKLASSSFFDSITKKICKPQGMYMCICISCVYVDFRYMRLERLFILASIENASFEPFFRHQPENAYLAPYWHPQQILR